MGVRTRLECKVHDDLRLLQCVHVVLNEATVDRYTYIHAFMHAYVRTCNMCICIYA